MVTGERTDEELAREACEGREEAFAALYDRHSRRLLDFARRLVRDDDDAADVTQNAFVKAYQSLHRDAPPASVRPWLFAIAHHEAIDRLRRRRFTSDISDDALAALPATYAYDSPERAAEARETAAWVWRAAAALPPAERAVLLLNVREGLDADGIARALGKRRDNVYVMLGRARTAFEDAFASMLLAARGTRDCSALAKITAGEDMSPALRRRIRAHIAECETCDANRRRFTSPAELLAGFAPVAPVAISLDDVWRRLRAPRPAQARRPEWLRVHPALIAAAAAAAGLIAALVAIALIVAGGGAVEDTVRPADPVDVRSTSHLIGDPSSDRSIRIVWSPAIDGAPEGGEPSGIGAYSVEWSQAPDTVPDMTPDLGPAATSAESGELPDGEWWFHLSTVDAAGNWTRTVHLGAFVIAAERPPTPPQATPSVTPAPPAISAPATTPSVASAPAATWTPAPPQQPAPTAPVNEPQSPAPPPTGTPVPVWTPTMPPPTPTPTPTIYYPGDSDNTGGGGGGGH